MEKKTKQSPNTKLKGSSSTSKLLNFVKVITKGHDFPLIKVSKKIML